VNSRPAIANDYENTDPALRAAHHYIFDGITVASQRGVSPLNKSCIYLSGGVAHDIQFRHVEVRGDDQVSEGFQREIARGVTLEAVNVTFSDSSIDDWHSKAMVIGDSEAGGFNPDQPFPQMPPNWFSQAVVESRSAIRYLGNAGSLADSAANMAQRLQRDVISKGPDKVFILAGYTDVGFLPPVSDIVGNVAAMIAQLKSANIVPILCTLPPMSPTTNYGFTTEAIPQELNAVNQEFRRLADQQGIRLVDLYTPLADPATGGYRPGYSADGFHPQMPATQMEAQAAITSTVGLFGPVSPWAPSSDFDGINLISDPLYLQSPSKWTQDLVKGTVTMQVRIGSDPAMAGNSVTLTNVDAGSASTLSGVKITKGFHAGDRLAFSGRIKSMNCESGNMQFSVGLFFDNVGFGEKSMRNNTHPIFRWPVDIQDGQFYMEFTVPAALDPSQPLAVTPVIELNSGISNCPGCTAPSGSAATGGTGTVIIGQIGLVNLTAIGIGR
jgi:lysophospholipase L1-like esterase